MATVSSASQGLTKIRQEMNRKESVKLRSAGHTEEQGGDTEGFR